MLRQHRDIAVEISNNECFDVFRDKISIWHCKFEQGNQYFRYDVDTQQIFVGVVRHNRCMEVEEGDSHMIIVAECDEEKISQKWKWGSVNETMLRNWADYGKPIKDEEELTQFSN
jgi:hypothetical protein